MELFERILQKLFDRLRKFNRLHLYVDLEDIDTFNQKVYSFWATFRIPFTLGCLHNEVLLNLEQASSVLGGRVPYLIT